MLDKNAYIAIALSLVIWVGWQKFYMEPIQQRAAEVQRVQEEAAKEAEAKKALDTAALAPKESASSSAQTGKGIRETKPAIDVRPLRTLELENGDSTLTLSNDAFAIHAWTVRHFSGTKDKQEDAKMMGDTTGFNTQMRVRFAEDAVEQPWDDVKKTAPNVAESELRGKDVRGMRRFVLDDKGFGGRIEYKLHFENEPPKFVFLDVYGSPKRASDHDGSIFGQAPDKLKVNFRDPNGRHSHIGADLKASVESASGVKWLGLDDRYFTLALVPMIGPTSNVGAQVTHTQLAGPAVRGSLVFPTEGKKDVSFAAKVYFGPKDMARLHAVDPFLTDAIDFGWTSFIAIPLLQSLKWLFLHVNNYGLAIILLTFIIKMLLFPLMYKSMKSMAKMTKLQPQLNALREKYKDDKEKLNVEMMSFMKQNGYNPIGGCLPILLQMPIFFALYRVLFNSTELLHAPFALWIHDLSSPDPFFVTPVLLTGLMYLQQKLSPNTAADPAQQKMLQIMPVMFGAFMLMLPSGLTIYMVVNSAVSIAQQYYLNHQLGITRTPAKSA